MKEKTNKKNILFIGTKYDYGKPERGLSYEYYNFYDTLVKMNNGNNRVIYFPFDEFSIKFGSEAMNKKLLEKVKQEKPDLCFFFLFNEFLKKDVVREITKKAVP